MDDLQQVVEVVRDAAGQLANGFHLLRLLQRPLRLTTFSHLCFNTRLKAFVELPQLLFGTLSVADLPLQTACMLLKAEFRLALLGNVGMDTNPFLDLALRVQNGHGPDDEGPIDPIVTAHPMLPDVRRLSATASRQLAIDPARSSG